MAPKAAVKPGGVKTEPSTPKSKPKASAADTPKKAPSTTPRKPKLAAPPRDYKILAADGDTSVITVKYEGSQQALALPSGGHSLNLELGAANAFTVVKSTVLTEGPYQGYQAIILRPAKPFKFMDLPIAVRNTVYRMYFAPKGLTEETTAIVLDGKRATDKVPYSKSFADGSKQRVGLLAVSKMVNAEAAAILYNHPLRFESTTVLGEFLVEYRSTRSKICNVEVKNYKKGARMALILLAEAPNIRRLRLEGGVSTETDPRKAAKALYMEAAQLLEAIGKQKQAKDAGVEVLEFGKEALTIKGGGNYNTDMRKEFIESLKKLCN
ncbi:uncharacterized protein RCC_05398 [Ramularia collo-cygni]|uniref:Uncharacterized protein n=1 Tax=Ramularia collo-cygni TaxID=112498 RepID=A0A2D3V4D1_9PEZI|nr:uncharacterized protein RCC_05398 [Ramularia collo-cygni]CZT19547.1 uncharacterized protein RCC_05398 [Ramularia collo-cygni]